MIQYVLIYGHILSILAQLLLLFSSNLGESWKKCIKKKSLNIQKQIYREMIYESIYTESCVISSAYTVHHKQITDVMICLASIN